MAHDIRTLNAAVDCSYSCWILHCGYVFRVYRGDCDVIGVCRSDFFSDAVAKSETNRDCIRLAGRGLRSKTHKSIQRRRPCLTPRRIGAAGMAIDRHYSHQSLYSLSEDYRLKT